MKKILLLFLIAVLIIHLSTLVELRSSLRLFESRNQITIGGLAPLPGPTVEGTSTAGWFRSGVVVALNTQTDNVGVGTLNPSMKLQVQGSEYVTGNLNVSGGTFNFSNGLSTTTFTELNNNLGIGSSTPSYWFSLGGNLFATGTSTVGSLVATSSIDIKGIATLRNSTTSFNGVSYAFPSADGSNNQRLTTNGAGQLSWGTAGQQLATTTIYTVPGTYTWIQPSSGITKVLVEMVGGGGGGGGNTNLNNSHAGGGGGGGYVYTVVPVTGNVTVVVGNFGLGGKGGAGGGLQNGQDGTDSTFAGTFTLTAAHGSGGLGGSNGGGGAGGSSTNADFTIQGQSGEDGIDSTLSGGGGNSFMGYGGRRAQSAGSIGRDATSTATTSFGAGGSGSWSSGTNINGGNGAPGMVRITWSQ